MPAATDSSRNGWATDLVFDVREPKLAVSLRLDADVLRFFRGFGAGYQTRINEVLKAFMHARGGPDMPQRAMPPTRTKHAASNGKRAS
ncbi:MAG: BrnA antitoxin family protein [Rhodospirillales bacterium]|nr:BrnA antitoxin family protein [Acetobacter sp.]